MPNKPLERAARKASMSQAASQASAFYEEVASTRRVYTVLEDGDFLVFPVAGRDVVPFWSSRSRVEQIQREHSKYRVFACSEIDLDHFLSTTLPYLQEEGVFVGVNWSGKRLTGYDVAVTDVVANLEYWLTRGHRP